MEHGQARACTETLTPLVGVSILPLSSVARDRIVALPTADGTQEYVHCSRPLAGCQVNPPSTETSTLPTTPPPASEAVPLIDTALFACTVAAGWGEGDHRRRRRAIRRLRGGDETRLDSCGLYAHVSEEVDRRLLHGSVGVDPPRSWLPSRPHDHCTVPDPKTSAPLAAR